MTGLPRLEDLDEAPISVSFEFFPPKTEAMEHQLWAAIERLAPLLPRFISVTYGAGGTTRERTHAIAKRIQVETGVPAAAHLTCVGATCGDIDEIADSYWAAGIRHIVALRGDPPGGMSAAYVPHPGGYPHADALVAGLRRLHPFEVSVAAYPEVHPQAADAASDLDALKRKVDAGATRAITQFFFDTAAYERFVDRVEQAGIRIPIVPGLMPISNLKRTAEIAKACGASVPDWMRRQFDGLDDDPHVRMQVATIVAAEQCRQLHGLGVRQFHFYTLNRADLVAGICHLLGVRTQQPTTP
jgi:methylenetetrahydrofolate reductase (NADPH)